jgi:hypothetical protein
MEEAVQAMIQKLELFQDESWVAEVLLGHMNLALAIDMFGMPGKGRGADAALGGQGAVRDAGQEAAVNLRDGFMLADGTAGYQYHVSDSFSVISGWCRLGFRVSGEGKGGQNGWEGCQKSIIDVACQVPVVYLPKQS